VIHVVSFVLSICECNQSLSGGHVCIYLVAYLSCSTSRTDSLAESRKSPSSNLSSICQRDFFHDFLISCCRRDGWDFEGSEFIHDRNGIRQECEHRSDVATTTRLGSKGKKGNKRGQMLLRTRTRQLMPCRYHSVNSKRFWRTGENFAGIASTKIEPRRIGMSRGFYNVVYNSLDELAVSADYTIHAHSVLM